MAIKYPIYFSFRNAHNLFDKTTNRRISLQAPLFSLYCSTLHHTAASIKDPIEFYGEIKDVVHWTSTISGLVSRNRPKDAIDVFKLMLFNEQRPNYVTILSVLRSIHALRWKNIAFGVHGLVIKMGFELEISVVTALIGVYGNFHTPFVWKLFFDVPKKDLVLGSAMVSICAKSGVYMGAIEVFRNMICEGMEPNLVSIVTILPACAKLDSLILGKQVHGFALKTSFYYVNNIQNSLIDMYAKCRNFEYAAQVFARVQEKDVVTWKTMIRGCIENGYSREALFVFADMHKSCSEIDNGIFCDVIGAVSDTEEFIFGLGLHCYSLRSGFAVSVSVGTALLQMYAKFGEVEPSWLLFDQLHLKDLIAWTAMISAYAQSGYTSEALSTFQHMQSASEKPNEVTFVSLLQACSSSGTQELGENIHGYVTKAGYLHNSFLISALIDLYCKFGKTKEGRALFDKCSIKDLIIWSSMINGYGLNGCANEALEIFSNMLEIGVKPNDVVFVSVLSACSHCGLEDEGWHWFYCMQEKYGIVPKIAHYACMVDLLSRQGNVEEGLDFVYSMQVEPDKRIWGSLLAGCRLTHVSITVVERVAEHLIRLDPEDISCYVVLSNFYAEEGRWDDVERVRKLIDDKGMEKMTGYSTV
ncbi:pentatricopeptide repeat-containing protein DOT4, chloroplastic-like [Chenopodium quinoa]|uniref:Pentatricopeptide repeat-containing protein n=1 Tax=Chenopodium quinoa TaxID=63459 RepID=A0A803KZ95_CHEQI|nr:pentatricopeptide repeat-containing protein DOT4, chloroplastic-like [Chenopodium quinoa]